jgi:hypothetical protein
MEERQVGVVITRTLIWQWHWKWVMDRCWSGFDMNTGEAFIALNQT